MRLPVQLPAVCLLLLIATCLTPPVSAQLTPAEVLAEALAETLAQPQADSTTQPAGAVAPVQPDNTVPVKPPRVDTPPAAPLPPIIRLQRVFVPESDENQLLEKLRQSLGGIPYLTMEREKYLNRVKKLVREKTRLAPAGARVAQALYHANWDRDRLTGIAEMQVEVSKPGEHFASIAGNQLAIISAAWRNTPPTDARLAMTPAGDQVLQVASPGTVDLAWTLRGVRNEQNAYLFDLSFPLSAVSKMTFDLPEGFTPRASAGVVRRAPEAEAGNGADAPSYAVGEPAAGEVRWLLLAPAAQPVRLSINPQQPAGSQQIVSRSQVQHTITQRGLRYEETIQLDIHGAAPEEMLVQLTGGLQLTAVRCNGKEVPFALKDNSLTAAIDLPDLKAGESTTIQLQGRAAITAGARLVLPTAVLSAAAWESESITVRIDRPLEAATVDLKNCVQTSFSKTEEASTGAPAFELRRYTSLSPGAAVTVQLRETPASLIADCGSTVNIGPLSTTATFVARLSVKAHTVFDTRFTIPREWIVDSTSVKPDTMLDDWSISTAGSADQVLHLRLKQPVKREQPVEVTIRMHRRVRADLTPTSARLLKLAEIPAASQINRTIAVYTSPPFLIELTNDAGLTRLQLAKLPASVRTLLSAPDRAIVFQGYSSKAQVKLLDETVQYSGSLQTTAVVDKETLEEVHTIQCTPSVSSVSSLLVHFAIPGAAPLQWRLPESGAGGFTVHELTAAEQQMANVGSGESYRIDFDRPRRKAFSLIAARVAPAEATRVLPLPSLPSAVSQSGLLLIGVKNGEELELNAGSLRSAPLPLAEPGQATRIRAAYIFDPAQTANVSVTPRRSARKPVWAWMSDIRSQFGAASASHHAVYKLENAGAKTLEIQLPAAAKSISATVDHSPAATTYDGGKLTIGLPHDKRFPLVEVRFVMDNSELGKWSVLSPPALVPGFQVIQHRWAVATPPGYHISPAADQNKSLADLAGSRIFGGFFARGSTTSQQLPAPVAAWLPETWPAGASDTPEQKVLATLGQWLQAEPDSNGGKPKDWASLVQYYDNRRTTKPEESLPRLLIDSVALHNAGVRPGLTTPQDVDDRPGSSPLPAAGDASSAGMKLAAASMLEQAGLGLHRSGADIVVGAMPASRAALISSQTYLLSPSKWLTAEPPATPPWLAVDRPQTSLFWQVQSDVTSCDPPHPLVVSQPAFWRTAGWAALFFSATAAIAFLRRWPLLTLPAFAIAVVAAMTAPPVIAPVATGACLGLMAALLVFAVQASLKRMRRIRPDESNESNDQPGRRRGSQTATATFWAPAPVVLFVVCGIYSQLEAAEPPRKIIDYKVVVPVDKDEKPVGLVFVPKPVYDRMLTLEDDAVSTGYPWLLTRASYECQLRRQATGAALEISSCRARFQIDVRRRGAIVKLPFTTRQLDLLPGSVQIDGSAAEFVWSPGGDSLEIEAPEAGVQELSVVFHPRTTSASGRTSFEINIPPAPLAELRVKTVEDINGLDLPTAFGAARIDSVTGDLVTPLGPTAMLKMNWPQQVNLADTMQPSVKQLMWLQIQPKSVLCNTATSILAPLGKAIRTFEFDVDPRLQIAAGRSSNISSITTAPQLTTGGMKRLTLVLDRDYQGEEISLHVSYLLTGATGVGVTRLPEIQPINCRTTRRWFAVSIGQGLNHTIQATDRLPPQSASSFRTAWQQAGAPATASATPDVAYAAVPTATGWSISTAPPNFPVNATIQEVLRAGADQVDYEALIEVDAGETRHFQHSFSQTGRWLLREATLVQAGATSPLGFASGADGSLSVFSSKPLSGEYRIRLRGELRRNPGRSATGNVWHTLLQFNGALVDQHYLDLHRQSNALVKTERVIKLEPNLIDSPPILGEASELTGRWQVEQDAGGSPAMPRINFKISPNRPRAECHRLVRLDRIEGEWKATMRCQGSVTRDQLDTLRIEFSPQWTAPFQCEPKARITIEQIPGSPHSRMLLAFEKPLRGEFKVRVTGNLRPAAAERISAPVIEPLDMARVERRLLLPMRAQEQLFNWKIGGLIKDPLPGIFSDEISGEPTAAYRVVGARPKAEIAEVENIKGTPQVWLSDVYLRWSENGQASGVACFDLEPGGLDSFDVRLPSGWRLIKMNVGGAPVIHRKIEDNRWRIDSGLRQLPQRVSIVFNAALQRRGDGWLIESPELVDIPVARQLWTIYGPEGQLQTTTEEQQLVGQRQQEIFRHTAICSIVTRAADTLGESNPRDVARWYPAWVGRLLRSRSRFNRLQAGTTDDTETFEEKHRTVGERLSRWAGESATWKPAPVNASPSSIFRLQHIGQQPLLLAFHGTSPGFSVGRRPAGILWQQQLLLGAAIAAVLCAIWLLLRVPRAARLAMRLRYVIGVAVGIGWWLALAPGIFGLMFAAISVLAALWKRPRPPAASGNEASAVKNAASHG